MSATIADGPPRRVLEAIGAGAAELVLPAAVPVELRRVLGEKLGLDAGAIGSILALLEELAVEVAGVPARVDAATGDPDDDRILAAAVAARADVLVSGDTRHLLPLGGHRGVRILRPQDLLAELVA